VTSTVNSYGGVEIRKLRPVLDGTPERKGSQIGLVKRGHGRNSKHQGVHKKRKGVTLK